MRTKLNFYLDGQLIGVANNWQGINISMIYEDDNIQPKIETDELEFVLTENSKIRQWVEDGVNGGVGIYEPPDLKIEITDGTDALTVFDGMLDMVNDMSFVDCNKVRVKLTKKGGVANFTQRTQAFSFAYLYSLPTGVPGKISDNDFIDVPYVLAHIPNRAELMMLSISIFVISKEIYENIRQLAKNIAIISGDAADVPPNSLGAGTSTLILLFLEIAYVGTMIFAVTEFIKDLIENLLSPVSYFKGMKLQTLLEKGAEHIGYTFESTFFNNVNHQNLVILPIKENRPNNKGYIIQLDGTKVLDTGYPTNKGQLYTYYDMLQFFKSLINGKIKLKDNVIRIERNDYWSNDSGYVLPDVLLEEYSYNADEINGNFNLQFALDEKDDTTLTNYNVNKTNYQRITEPKIIKDRRNVMIKNLEQVNLSVSLPTRKEKLTIVETTLLTLTRWVDDLLDVFKSKERFADKIINRKGMLLLANDFTSVPKLISMQNDKVHKFYRTIMNAEILYNNYHFINSFVAEPTNYSQYKKFEKIKIPFCFKDYITLSENSWFKTSDGKEGKFERIDGIPDGGYAEVDFRIKEIFTKNLRDRIL